MSFQILKNIIPLYYQWASILQPFLICRGRPWVCDKPGQYLFRILFADQLNTIILNSNKPFPVNGAYRFFVRLLAYAE